MKSQTERMRGNEVRMPSFFHSSPTLTLPALPFSTLVDFSLAGRARGQAREKQSQGRPCSPRLGEELQITSSFWALRAAGRASGEMQRRW